MGNFNSTARRAVWREAQKRWRARQKKAQASYRVDADGAVLNMLLAHKYIEEHEIDDQREVGAAITLLLADLAADYS
jgi:hypothetical protein